MKKSANEKEIEKLKKQVEKLKKEKMDLQREKRNLKDRLSTANNSSLKNGLSAKPLCAASQRVL